MFSVVFGRRLLHYIPFNSDANWPPNGHSAETISLDWNWNCNWVVAIRRSWFYFVEIRINRIVSVVFHIWIAKTNIWGVWGHRNNKNWSQIKCYERITLPITLSQYKMWMMLWLGPFIIIQCTMYDFCYLLVSRLDRVGLSKNWKRMFI